MAERGIGGSHPAAGGGEEGREALIVFRVEDAAGFLCGGGEDGAGLIVGLIRLAFLDAERGDDTQHTRFGSRGAKKTGVTQGCPCTSAVPSTR